MVRMMRSKEAHHSVNLKENSRTDIWCSSRQTKEREIERASERRGIQSRAKSALLWDGGAGLERGLRCSLTVEPAFIRYIILLGLHTSIDISSSASHQSPAVMPAYSVSNKINAYTHSVCVRKQSDSKLTVPTVCKAHTQFNILFNVSSRADRWRACSKRTSLTSRCYLILQEQIIKHRFMSVE